MLRKSSGPPEVIRPAEVGDPGPGTEWIDASDCGVLPALRLHLRMRERLADRVRHCFWLTVSPGVRDWQAFRLPPTLQVLHYCLRPLRLVKQELLRSGR